MDVSALANVTDIDLLQNLVSKVSTISAVFQAIGGLILAYIIFNVVSVIMNKKKNKELEKIRMLLEQINKKIKKK